MELTRRSFLFGLPLVPWLVKPLRAIGMPVKDNLVVLGYSIKPLEDGKWHYVEGVYDLRYDRQGHMVAVGNLLRCKIDDKECPKQDYFALTDGMISPLVEQDTLNLRIGKSGQVFCIDSLYLRGERDE